MSEAAIYAWAVLAPGPTAKRVWRIFKHRQEARAYRREHGGLLYKISRAH